MTNARCLLSLGLLLLTAASALAQTPPQPSKTPKATKPKQESAVPGARPSIRPAPALPPGSGPGSTDANGRIPEAEPVPIAETLNAKPLRYASLAPTPAKLPKNPYVVKLPGCVQDLVVGGSGRFLIARHGPPPQLSIFDICEHKLVRILPLSTHEVVFAAGAEKLVVYEQGKLTRYSLKTMAKEAENKVENIRALCLGHSSQGPLLVAAGLPGVPKLAFYDLATLRPATITVGWAKPLESDRLRASADGRTFVSTIRRQTSVLKVQDNKAEVAAGPKHDFVCPSPDGTQLLGRLQGLEDVNSNGKWALPATSGRAYVEIPQALSVDSDPEVDLSIVVPTRPAIPLHVGAPERMSGVGRMLPEDRRIIVVPEAETLVFLGGSYDKYYLYHVVLPADKK